MVGKRSSRALIGRNPVRNEARFRPSSLRFGGGVRGPQRLDLSCEAQDEGGVVHRRVQGGTRRRVDRSGHNGPMPMSALVPDATWVGSGSKPIGSALWSVLLRHASTAEICEHAGQPRADCRSRIHGSVGALGRIQMHVRTRSGSFRGARIAALRYVGTGHRWRRRCFLEHRSKGLVEPSPRQTQRILRSPSFLGSQPGTSIGAHRLETPDYLPPPAKRGSPSSMPPTITPSSTLAPLVFPASRVTGSTRAANSPGSSNM